jgi:uncharacterized membrane protein YeaQ/YmgE (transglycosylase-associated protein family)
VTEPGITLAVLIATLYGAAAHLIFGGDARRFALFLIAGWTGFAIGQVIGMLFNLPVVNVGTVYFLPATIGAGISLAFIVVLTTRWKRKRVSRM